MITPQFDGADQQHAALWLAERHGLHVFPVDNPSLPQCAGVGRSHDPGTCTDRGKHPAVPWGTWAAHHGTDALEISARWADTPYNVGVACAPSGIVVLDEDDLGALDRLADAHGQTYPRTLIVTTGRGRHMYLRDTTGGRIGNSSALAQWHIDVRGAGGRYGGYVVGPGSLHSTGVIYTPVDPDAPIADIPDWLVDLLAPAPAQTSPAQSHGTPGTTGQGASQPHQGDGAAWRQHQDVIPHGQRHQALVSYAGRLRASGLSIDEATPVYRLYWERCAQPPHAPDAYTWDQAAATLRDVYGRYPAGRDLPAVGAAPDSPTQSHGTTWDDEESTLHSRLEALRALMVDTDGLDDIPDPDPVIDDVIYLDSLAWLHGKPGHGKSFVALDWAGCVATGRPWQGHGVAHPGAVVYLVAEGARGVRQRVRAWESYHGTPMRGVQWLPTAVQLLDPIDREAFARLVADYRPVLVVIDTQARVSVGADENSAQDMGRLIAAADLIRERTGACVLLVHHEARQGETLRGSTALEGAAHTLIRVTKDGPHIRIDCTKQKDAPPFDPLRLRLTAHGPSAVLESHGGVGLAEELAGTEQRLVATLRDSFGTTGATGAQLREVSEIPKSSFYRALNSLVTMGLVVNTGTAKRPFYVLADRAPNQQSHAVPRSPVGLADSQSHVPPPYRGGTGGTDRPTGPDEDAEGAPAEETLSALTEVPEEWGEWSA